MTETVFDEGRDTQQISVRSALMIGVLSLLGPLCIDVYLPALPRVAEALQGSPSQLQFTLTACLLGLATGQLLIGPVSDALGRRGPLILGMATFAMASTLCAVATNVGSLVVFRFLEGLGGSAGIVLARAMIRDRYSGAAAARFYSLQLVMVGAGPMLAPSLGAFLLRIDGWRGVFGALAFAGLVLLTFIVFRLPETLPPERRLSLSLRGTTQSIGQVVRDPVFRMCALASGASLGAIFAYVGGSAFVLEELYRLTPQEFGAVYAVNAIGLVCGSAASSRLLRRCLPETLMTLGCVGIAVSGVSLLALVAFGMDSIAAVVLCMLLLMTSFGFVGGNTAAVALERHPESAGSASALLGVMQFIVGSVTAPLSGIAGARTLIPMAAIMAVSGATAAIACSRVKDENRLNSSATTTSPTPSIAGRSRWRGPP